MLIEMASEYVILGSVCSLSSDFGKLIFPGEIEVPGIVYWELSVFHHLERACGIKDAIA